MEELNDERQEKIKQYENFVENKLKVNLMKILEAKDKLYQSISDYLELKKNIILIKENEIKTLKSLVNLGSDFFVKAKVKDTTHVFVTVGLGIQAQFTLDEALEFIEKKVADLQAHCDLLTDDENKIKTRISLVYEGINELMQLDDPQRKKRSDLYA